MAIAATRARPIPLDPMPGAQTRPAIRIALFSGNYNYVRDGANRALNRLVEDLEQRGAHVRVYSPTAPDPAFAPSGTLVSVPSIRLPGRGDYRLGLGLSSRLRSDIHSFKPDLIHVSAPDWTGLAAQRLARALHVPLVASLHTRFETYARFYGAGLVRPAIERHLRRFYRKCDCILVPTYPILDEFAAEGLGEVARLWSRGVDRHQFDPARRDLSWRRVNDITGDDCAVLFFGRLVREKGLADYVEVIDRLAGAGVAVKPLVIGDGPEREWLRQRLPAARLTGHLDGAALGRAVASADIFFNPSVTEAFGNVTLEAMASGLPTVSVDAPSAAALLDHGGGLLYPAGDLDAATEALARLVMFPERRRAIGRRAREASAGYSWDRASAMVWDAFTELLARGATR
ncbi:glycosyltransferase family 1 protein [Sphingomonas sp. 2SG]|uniref:glycosyltransferase family 4 protein n=1 Tax=Sphingomonas sp. 2SG TaxID=2502201 RepID=UPI00201603D8|nr:glycosyltransferase family 1 protein [Sphingomonas sp. 2SG]